MYRPPLPILPSFCIRTQRRSHLLALHPHRRHHDQWKRKKRCGSWLNASHEDPSPPPLPPPPHTHSPRTSHAEKSDFHVGCGGSFVVGDGDAGTCSWQRWSCRFVGVAGVGDTCSMISLVLPSWSSILQHDGCWVYYSGGDGSGRTLMTVIMVNLSKLARYKCLL